ncbi:MAG: transcriptional regulator GcvA [Gammaproteobacteria bacterium]|nr:transcriptional regulator GcvA [Gammaproteobacteria bacterium]
MAHKLPPLNALRAFEAAGRLLSFSRAAEELHVTRAAVSQQVALLEEQLGTRLFRRKGRALEITDAGRACLPKIQQGFDLLASGVELAVSEDVRGPLVVSCSPTLASRWLVSRLDDFSRLMPETDVRLEAQYGLPDFRNDEADVAVHFGPMEFTEELHHDPLFDVSIVPLCSPKLCRGKGALREPADLARFRLLHDGALEQDPDDPGWASWLERFAIEGVDASRGMRFSHTMHALEAAADGQGVLLAIDRLAVPDVLAGRLVVPFDLRQPLESGYALVTLREWLARRKVAAFRDWLLSVAAQDVDPLTTALESTRTRGRKGD